MEERQDLLEKEPTINVEMAEPTENLVVSIEPSSFDQDYEMLGELGKGGMGTVHKVRCRKTGELMALKLMKSDLGQNPINLKRFRQEAAIELHHCNIVKVFHQDVTDNQAFIAMELIDGKSLAQRLANKQGKLDEPECTEIFLQICDALEFAHIKGVIHRDLKPSNVMIDTDALVKITDFGTAKLIPTLEEDVTRLTRTGEIFGSPLYMSPEQCIGEEIDHRTDIYSMGCLMYETLSGNPVFPGANPVKLIFQQVNCDPTPLRESGISEGICLIVGKCLQKDPAARYQSFAALRSDLELVKKGKKPECKIADQSLRSLAAASIAKRTAAALIDGAIMTCLLILVTMASFQEMPGDLALHFADLSFCFLCINNVWHSISEVWSQEPTMTAAASLAVLISGIVNWLYRAGFESSKLRATPGKLVMGLRVIDLRGDRANFLRSTIRHFVKGLLVLGPLMILGQIFGEMTIEDRTLKESILSCFRRIWWDRVSGTRVIDLRSKSADSWRRK